ncbi:MAG: methionine gamma-lyase family protein, partial [Acidaminococcaceae bacterium]|nr:methionine gamma-lyase family protein [Acidaminococcaceae bacterium]
ELSCDGPLREPYNVYFQGGLTFEHGRLAIMEAAKIVAGKKQF